MFNKPLVKLWNEGCVLEMRRIDDETYSIRNLWSKIRRAGYATELVGRACEAADEEHITLELYAIPYGKGEKLELDDLVSFYEQFDFYVGPFAKPILMSRPPLSERL